MCVVVSFMVMCRDVGDSTPSPRWYGSAMRMVFVGCGYCPVSVMISFSRLSAMGGVVLFC